MVEEWNDSITPIFHQRRAFGTLLQVLLSYITIKEYSTIKEGEFQIQVKTTFLFLTNRGVIVVQTPG